MAQQNINISGKAMLNAFPLVNNNAVPTFYYDVNDAKVVQLAAQAFVKDLQLVSNKAMQLKTGKVIKEEFAIIAGTIGHAAMLDQLIASKKIGVNQVKGRWEKFSITIVHQPDQKAKQLLVIAGSDPRGTAYGIFHLSRLMGVSPFVWWADALPQQKKQLFISGSYIAKEPTVKYRGIFLNDEDWGLQPWAAKTFEPETGDIGPKTYAKIFELLLRLKANLIWPAMHECTKPFFTIPGNTKIAGDYAIIIGSSHAEPMLRTNTGEWSAKTMGNFNYVTNKDSVYKYWEERVKESKGINAMYSMGMRGVHDSKMEGVKDAKDAVPLLHTIFKDQRNLLRKYIDTDIKKVPQVFTAYKEVLDIYDNGLQLPDDITLVWPDDNYGYIQRLNNQQEMHRSGGSGVYYHASYWGRPHDYLWISTTNPALIREEMMKAYTNGSNLLWVLNVGDIKPLEYNIEMFMDMAYDAVPFKNSSYSKFHLGSWAAYLFGSEKATAIQTLLWEYYQLAFERRPEFMGWSQTEPTTKTNYTAFNHFYYGDEAQHRIDRYQRIENKVRELRTQMGEREAAAFYQLVYYPVVGASLMNKKYVYRDKHFLYAKQQRLSAMEYAQLARVAHDSILKETDYYNNDLVGGKWKNMLSSMPRNLPVFHAPELRGIAVAGSSKWGVVTEGMLTSKDSLQKSNALLQLPLFDNLNRQRYFIDLFLTENNSVKWTATTGAPWIRFSSTLGILTDVVGKKQQRIFVTVDWDKVPKQANFSGIIKLEGSGKLFTISVVGANHPLKNYKGFVENNGYVSIHAHHFARQVNQLQGKWQLLPGMGYSGVSLQSGETLPANIRYLKDTAWIKKNSAFAEYDFCTFSADSAKVEVSGLPTHPLNNDYSMRFAVSIDNGPLEVLNYRTYGRSEEWKQNVLSNRAVKTTSPVYLDKGQHRLRIYAIDPGVVLDAIVIDLGGLRNAYGVIPETRATVTN